MALPNPNDKLVTSSETQTLTLKDLLFYQKETEKWSQNTDVNTFRGNIEEQEQGESLLQAIKEMSTGEKGSLKAVEEAQEKTGRTIGESFKTLGKTIFKPFERLSKNLNNIQFGDFGENVFTSATDAISVGSERVKTGFKELTNGIGALGPVINNLKTMFYKVTAVGNMFIGGLQLIAGVIAKSIQTVGRAMGFDMGQREEQLKEEQEKLQAEADKAEEDLQLAKEAVEAQRAKEKALDESNLPLPVNVENQRTGGKQEEPVMFYDSAGNVINTPKEEEEQQEEQSDKMKELLEDQMKAEKALKNKKANNEANLNKQKELNEKKRFKGFRGLIARLNAFSLLGLLKFMGFAALLGGIIYGIKNNIPGVLTGATEVAKRSFVGLTKIVDAKVVQPFKKFTGIGLEKPAAGVKGDVVPKGTKPFEFEGKTYRPGNPLPNDVKMNPDGTGAKRISGTPNVAPKPGIGAKVAKVASKAVTPIAGVVETGMDISANTKKFENVKAAYEAGIPFMTDQETGKKRPMTPEEFKLLEKAQKANFTGSVGRGVGAVGGAMLGAAALSWLGPFGMVVGGIGGAIYGAAKGDDAATGLAEVFTGTENSQEMLDQLAAQVPNQPAEAIEEVQTQIANTQTTRPQGQQQYYNQQQVVNNQNDTISVGKTPFSNTQLEYSYGN